MASAEQRARENSLLRRMYKNAGMLFGGKAAGGLISIATLALAARALGAEGLGLLALIQAFAMTILTLIRVPLGTAVIRYGALYVEKGEHEKLQALIKLNAVTATAYVVLTPLILAALLPFFGETVGIGPELIPFAIAYGVAAPFAEPEWANSILRLFDRFRHSALQMTAMPVLRLLGAAALLALGAGLVEFILLWMVAAVLSGLVAGWLAFRALRDNGVLTNMDRSLRGIYSVHDRLGKFLLPLWVTMGIGVVPGHLTTLMIGGFLDASAAGYFRVAQQFTHLIGKPVNMLSQSIVPELSRLRAQADFKVLGRMTLRAALYAMAVGIPLAGVFVLVGKPALRLIAGPEFAGAYSVLVLLAIYRVIGLTGFALSPALISMGRPGRMFRSSLIATLTYVIAAPVLVQTLGLAGIGVALIIFITVKQLFSGFFVYSQVHYFRDKERNNAAE